MPYLKTVLTISSISWIFSGSLVSCSLSFCGQVYKSKDLKFTTKGPTNYTRRSEMNGFKKDLFCWVCYGDLIQNPKDRIKMPKDKMILRKVHKEALTGNNFQTNN